MTDFSPEAADAAIAENAKQKKTFFTSMLKAREELPEIVKQQDAGRYKYADLASIARVVDPILAAHGIGYHWGTKSLPDGNVEVTCHVWHVDGYSHENSMSAPADTSGGKQPIQAQGSTVTYLQRYTLLTALGVAVARDDDGAASPAKRVTAVQAKQLLNESHGLDVEAILAKLGISDWTELPQADFQKVVGKLKVTREKEESK